MHPKRIAAAAASATALLLFAASCGEATEATETAAETAAETDTAESTSSAAETIRLVSPSEGEAIRTAPPAGLIVLDVRTAEEFAEGHLDGATMVDFYAEDFADQLAGLDRTAPYLLYCRSGNRSGQTATMMRDLGFTDVAEIDGGILAWTDAGLPISQ